MRCGTSVAMVAGTDGKMIAVCDLAWPLIEAATQPGGNEQANGARRSCFTLASGPYWSNASCSAAVFARQPAHGATRHLALIKQRQQHARHERAKPNKKVWCLASALEALSPRPAVFALSSRPVRMS